jgi:hypothetical protein
VATAPQLPSDAGTSLSLVEAGEEAALRYASLAGAVDEVLSVRVDELTEDEITSELEALEPVRRRLDARVCRLADALSSRAARRAEREHGRGTRPREHRRPREESRPFRSIAARRECARPSAGSCRRIVARSSSSRTPFRWRPKLCRTVSCMRVRGPALSCRSTAFGMLPPPPIGRESLSGGRTSCAPASRIRCLPLSGVDSRRSCRRTWPPPTGDSSGNVSSRTRFRQAR